MAEKDLVEKKLEDYNDVFADIWNTLLFWQKGSFGRKITERPDRIHLQKRRG